MSLDPFAALTGGRRNTGTGAEPAVLRDFSKGLRTVEEEIGLKASYSVVLANCFRNQERDITIRYGTKLFREASTDIVHIVYFAGSLLAFLVDGRIEAVDRDGNDKVVWSNNKANELPGSPDGWRDGVTHVSTAVFKRSLIVCNGKDKPLIIDEDLAANYLQDPATGNNIFTPIAKYVASVNGFCVMAGIGDDLELYISSEHTAGVWPGDADPNNAITFNLTANSGAGDKQILGLAEFRNQLVVLFRERVVLISLGEFSDDGIHKPRIIDAYSDMGILGPKTYFTTNSDVVFCGPTGVFTGARSFVSTNIETRALSDNIRSGMLQVLAAIPQDADDCFVVRDRSASRVFFFLKDNQNRRRVYCMTYRAGMRDIAWSTVNGWDFDCGCETAENKLFLCKGNKVYQYGNNDFEGEDYRADYITPENPEGDAITIAWELPWLDANRRLITKQMSHLVIDAQGSAQFKVELFVDRLYRYPDGARAPVSTLTLVAGTDYGYGRPAEGYGGGRATSTERMYRLPARFKLLKFRITATTREPLSISAIGFLYRTGRFKR